MKKDTLKIDPVTATEHFKLGLMLNDLGRYKEAIEAFSKAIKLRISYAAAFSSRGDTFNNIGLYEEAIHDYEKAILLKSPSFEIFCKLGTAQYNLGRYQEAIKSFDRAIELNPYYTLAMINRGNSYDNLGYHKEALQDYDRVIELLPDSISGHYNRAYVKDKLGLSEEAIKAYSEVIQLRPKMFMAYNNRGVAKGNLGCHAEAREDYDKTIQLKPDYGQAYNNRGVAEDNLGRYSEAIQDYDKAIQLRPDYVHAHNNRGISKEHLGRYSDAIKDYDKAIQLEPDYAPAYINRAIAKFNLNRHEEAIQDLTRAMELEPMSISSYYLGMICLLQKDLIKAKSHLELCQVSPYGKQGKVLLDLVRGQKTQVEKIFQQINIESNINIRLDLCVHTAKVCIAFGFDQLAQEAIAKGFSLKADYVPLTQLQPDLKSYRYLSVAGDPKKIIYNIIDGETYIRDWLNGIESAGKYVLKMLEEDADRLTYFVNRSCSSQDIDKLSDFILNHDEERSTVFASKLLEKKIISSKDPLQIAMILENIYDNGFIEKVFGETEKNTTKNVLLHLSAFSHVNNPNVLTAFCNLLGKEDYRATIYQLFLISISGLNQAVIAACLSTLQQGQKLVQNEEVKPKVDEGIVVRSDKDISLDYYTASISENIEALLDAASPLKGDPKRFIELFTQELTHLREDVNSSFTGLKKREQFYRDLMNNQEIKRYYVYANCVYQVNLSFARASLKQIAGSSSTATVVNYQDPATVDMKTNINLPDKKPAPSMFASAYYFSYFSYSSPATSNVGKKVIEKKSNDEKHDENAYGKF